jgi:hypothetical protein
MTNHITRGLVLATQIAPAAYAQGDASAKPPSAMNCAIMGQMTTMQKDWGGLMGDIDAMMHGLRPRPESLRRQL